MAQMPHIFGQKLEIPIIVNRKYPHKPSKLLLHAKYYVVPYHSATCYILHTPDIYAWVEGLFNGEMRRQMPLHEFF
jgi:hypothetical protein